MPDVTLDSLQSGGSYPQWATEESLQKLLMITKDTPQYLSRVKFQILTSERAEPSGSLSEGVS